MTANQENAKSGGVKTPEGKEITKYNALKHGVFRETITEYEEENFAEIMTQLVSELNPVGFVETLLVERIATSYIKLFRLAKAEGEHIKATIHPDEKHWKFDCPADAYTPQITSEAMQSLSNVYARYETTVENRLYKALHELERIQRMRKGETLPPPVTIDVAKVGLFCEN